MYIIGRNVLKRFHIIILINRMRCTTKIFFFAILSLQMEGMISSEGEEMSVLRWRIDQRQKQVGREDFVLSRGYVEEDLECPLGSQSCDM